MKTYLGDGAYAEYDEVSGVLTLTTTDGIEITNEVILDGSCIEALIRFIQDTGLIPRDGSVAQW